MKRLTLLFVVVLLGVPVWTSRAAELPAGAALVKTIDWKTEHLPAGAKLNEGGPENRSFISVENKEKQPVSIPLWETKSRGIQTKCYAVRGQIRYHAVEGTGYLDLWSSFAGTSPGESGGKYFSRTLANRGPLQKITGNSEWRDVVLPFDGTQSKSLPTGLELNLVLAGPGKVDVSDLQLLQFADAGSMWAALGNSAIGSQELKTARWIVAGVLAIGFALVSSVVALILRKKRQRDKRKMRAMDAA